jgi:hypothetical protein
MIDFPSTLTDIADAVQEGRPVDYDREAKLQALAIARAGEQFVAEAIAMQGEADEQTRPN